MLEKPYIVSLTCLLALLIVVLSVRRFHGLAIARRLSEYPKDARSWTTFYNFIFSAGLYVSLALVIFATLDNLPDLSVAIVSTFSVTESESLKSLIKGLMADSTRDWVLPIISAGALIALFGFEKSPLAFVDTWIREILQSWASIPSKVRNTVAQLEAAEFSLPPARRARVLAHIAKRTDEDPVTDFVSLIDDSVLRALLERSGSLDLVFQEWQSSGSAFNDLYSDNKDLMKKLSDEFIAITGLVGFYFSLLKSSGPDDAEAKLERGKRSIELNTRLGALLERQYVPFACGILQSSRKAAERRKFLAAFGFLVKEPISPNVMFEYMLEDLAQMTFLLMVTIYPAVYFLSRYHGWKPDNGYLDTMFIWPCQLGVFALASVLPALLWNRRLAQGGVQRPRGHYLAYFAVAVVGASSAVLLVALLGLVSASISVAPRWIGIDAVEAIFLKVIPFGLVAASIGAVTAILIDIPWQFPLRFVSDAIATGIVAAVVAVMAIMAQTNAEFDSIISVLTLDPAILAKNPGLRVLPFVIPIDFAMGFCVGAIIPRGYRQYRKELVIRPAEVARVQAD